MSKQRTNKQKYYPRKNVLGKKLFSQTFSWELNINNACGLIIIVFNQMTKKITLLRALLTYTGLIYKTTSNNNNNNNTTN